MNQVQKEVLVEVQSLKSYKWFISKAVHVILFIFFLFTYLCIVIFERKQIVK